MATAYTPILKLALPVTGELNGTWGNVVNDNITSMVEQAVAGLATINTWTANSHTLTTADGTTSESRCAMLVIDDDGAGNPSAAATVVCPTATKAYIVQNLCGQTVTVKTAAGTGVAVPNNQSALVFCNGTNVVTGAFNGDVVGPASATDNAIVRYDGATGKLIQNSGVTIDDSNNVSGVVQLNATTVDTTNIEVTNLKAKDGTTAGSIADSTGIVTLASTVLTTTDINGGTIDATTIGATTPSTVVATQVDITAQGDLRLQDTTGGEYVALQAPSTIASSYTLTLPVDDGTSGQALITDGSGVLSWSTAASGDVYGPASATDNAVARYDGTTGKIIQNSAVTIADDGATVISANSLDAALRITQIGAGNSILVEDSANPDATPFVVDAAGRVGIGTTTVSASNLEAVGTSAAIVTRGSATTSSASIGALAHDYYSAPSYRGTFLNQNSSAATGTTLGFANANLGYLSFTNVATNALIYTNGGTAIVFGTNSADRGRVSSAGVWSLGAAPGAESLRVTPVASAVNYFNAQGSATGNTPALSVQGSDANIQFAASSKGTAALNFFTNAFGQQQFAIAHTASAVNYLQVVGNVTGSGPVLSSQGSDTNINIGYVTKGTGLHAFATNITAVQFQIAHTASAVNYLQVTGAATGVAPVVTAAGSDTNIDLALTPKGTGNVRFGTLTATSDVAITGYIEIKDSAGNVRKLAVIT